MTPQEARHAGRVIASKVLDYGETVPHGLAAHVVSDLTRGIDDGSIPRALASEALRGAADHFEDVAKLTRETADEFDADKATVARTESEAS